MKAQALLVFVGVITTAFPLDGQTASREQAQVYTEAYTEHLKIPYLIFVPKTTDRAVKMAGSSLSTWSRQAREQLSQAQADAKMIWSRRSYASAPLSNKTVTLVRTGAAIHLWPVVWKLNISGQSTP